MCGIAGFVTFSCAEEHELLETARAMANQMLRRGPDAGGVWADPNAGFATGHRRLSIIDLSDAGAQPMLSACGRFVISYNGEVYNAGELRLQLETRGLRFILEVILTQR
jgi:asparagine synthase (glutamine-hydrolysing)